MLNEKIQPSTIGGIKRHAKQLKKANGISHHEALDIAARKASYQNYAHANNQYSRKNKLVRQLFFSVYWFDQKNKSYRAGREVLEVELSKPLLEIASKSELAKSSALGWFRHASLDHLVRDDVCHSQQEARDIICKAVRVLQFIESTGLKPSKDYDAAYPDRERYNKLPKSDHTTNWYDPSTSQFILIDEPYLKPVVDGERSTWAKKHKWHLQASTWPGIYYPGHTSMFVATDASSDYDFKGLMAKIDSMPYPLTSDLWEGHSTIGHEPFFSPLCVSSQDKKRAVAKGTIYRTSSTKTVPMSSWNAPRNERRPNAVMSVENHQLVARMIKAIEQSVAKPWTVNTRLSSIRCELENWFFAEYDTVVTNQFDLFYYGSIETKDPFVLQAETKKGVIQLIHELKDILRASYVDCEPLKRLIRKLDTSIKLSS